MIRKRFATISIVTIVERTESFGLHLIHTLFNKWQSSKLYIQVLKSYKVLESSFLLKTF